MACARPTDSDVEEEPSSDRISEPSVSTQSPKTPRQRSQTLEENTSCEKQVDEGTFKRRSRTLTFRRKKTEKVKDPTKKGRSQSWALRLKKKLPARLKKSTKDHGLPEPVRNVDAGVCVCTGYRRTEDHVLGPGVIFGRGHPSEWNMLTMGATAPGVQWPMHFFHQVPPPSQPNVPEGLDRSSFNAEEYPTEDIDEILIAQRASEIERGIEITSQLNRMSYPVIQPTSRARSRSPTHEAMARLSNALSTQCMIASTTYPLAQIENGEESRLMDCRNLMSSAYIPRTIHTQVDYIHCMVPDLLRITGCGFYWGVMDRYEAERLLDNRPEGTFLLRDSAQEDYLFSVSFRRYGRSLHARIEQWNHKFSFDSHDPGVFSANTVCGLIEHYKDPSCCMFFEPMLTLPLHRSFAFSLQHLCRAAISERVTYDGVSLLPLPKALRAYLQYYHYKQKVRVRKFDCQH